MAETWEIDPAHSTIEFSVKHMMFTTVRGRFKTFKGTINANRRDPNASTVTVDIDASSIDTGVGDRDAHLKSADFLDVATHPAITFRSKRVEGAADKEGDRFKLTGDLTIRGKTMEVTLDCTYQGRGKDPWGKERAGASATGEIDRRQWGLQWNQALETGGVLVGNTVKFEIDIQAVRAAASAAA